MNKYQREYVNRINRVIDYIEGHLDEDLNLEKLSGIAFFSPFHFHRIFSAFTGETLNNYIKRIRIEKAASLLLYDPDRSITEIAFYCGFNNSSVFSRNFRDWFGTSASKYRNEKLKSKIGQLHSNTSKDKHPQIDYQSDIGSIKSGGLHMNNNITVKEMPAMDLVYCRHVGDFHLIGQAYARLMNWAGPRGLLNAPDLKTITVYHDDPGVTDIEQVRQSACITVKGDVKTESEFGTMSVPSGKYIAGSFEITAEQFQEAWDSVCIALSESGYKPTDGRPYELYHNNHEEHPERKFIVDICVPVEPM